MDVNEGRTYWICYVILFMVITIFLTYFFTLLSKSRSTANRNRHYFESLFEYNPDIVCSLDLEGRIGNSNAATERISGYSKKDLEGQSFLKFILPEEAEKTKLLFDQVKQGIPQNCDVIARHKQGHIMEFNVTTIPIICRHTIVGAFAVCEDITERKRDEERLRKAEKLAMAGQLAAGIAHEIRNPLTTVRGMTQLIKGGTFKQRYLDLMLNEIGQIESILSEFLLLANPGDLKVSSLNRIIQNCIFQTEAQASLYNIKVLVDYESDTPWIYCDENKLKHVFCHLLQNALKSMENEGIINVQVSFKDSDKVQVRIIDQGFGISEEWQSKLGEPFYNTKEEGTGIGLMISYQIIQEHNGEIQLYNAEGQGTVVEVTLPVVEKKSLQQIQNT